MLDNNSTPFGTKKVFQTLIVTFLMHQSVSTVAYDGMAAYLDIPSSRPASSGFYCEGRERAPIGRYLVSIVF